MDSSIYIALMILVAVALAEDAKNKKEAIYNPFGQITTEANKYLTTGAYNYNNLQQPFYQSGYPYNQQYYQQQPFQRYNGNQQYYNPTGMVQYNNQYDYQHYPYGYQNAYNGYPNAYTGYPNAYNGYQNAYNGYQNAYTGQQNAYNPYAFRQLPVYPSTGVQPVYPISGAQPVYPSPGALPISPPVPHPFYHVQGTYYPTTTEANKPVTVVVDPKKIY